MYMYSVGHDFHPTVVYMRYWVRQNSNRLSQTSGVLEKLLLAPEFPTFVTSCGYQITPTSTKLAALKRLLRPFRKYAIWSFFLDNGVTHSVHVHSGQGLKELKVKFYDQNSNVWNISAIDVHASLYTIFLSKPLETLLNFSCQFFLKMKLVAHMFSYLSGTSCSSSDCSKSLKIASGITSLEVFKFQVIRRFKTYLHGNYSWTLLFLDSLEIKIIPNVKQLTSLS